MTSFVATLTYDYLKDRSDSVAMDARYNGDDPFVNENDWDAQTKYDQDMVGLVMDWDIRRPDPALDHRLGGFFGLG